MFSALFLRLYKNIKYNYLKMYKNIKGVNFLENRSLKFLNPYEEFKAVPVQQT